MGPARAGRREGAVVEARVASMVAQSEAVMATGVALVMGAGIAAMAAVNGGRLGGGGGLDRARGASTIPAERSGSGKGGYSTLGDLQIKGGGARQGTVKGTAARNPVLIFHVIPVGMCPRQACLTIPAGRQIRAVLQVQERAKGRILPSLGRHRSWLGFFSFPTARRNVPKEKKRSKRKGPL